MQKARRHPEGLRPLVSTRFQLLFHSLSKGSFHLSVALLFTIGRQGVLSLGGWSPRVQAGFHESDPTLGLTSFCTTGPSPSVVGNSMPFAQSAG